MAENLMDGLLSEMNRVREIIKEYESIPGNAGMFAATLMKLDIVKAEKSISEGDVIKMMIAYEALKEYQL